MLSQMSIIVGDVKKYEHAFSSKSQLPVWISSLVDDLVSEVLDFVLFSSLGVAYRQLLCSVVASWKTTTREGTAEDSLTGIMDSHSSFYFVQEFL